MLTCNRLLFFYGAVLACSSSCATAFFLNWGSSETTQQQPASQVWPLNGYYQHRFYQVPSTSYNVPVSESHQPQQVQIPAIPIQVPLKAQLAPAPNVQNVQLVPCLCPVSQDEYEKSQENSVLLNQIKNQQN